MSFSPVLPLGGYAGWAFLKRTKAAQQAAFVQQASSRREAEYYRANIGKIDNAEELVKDRRLLAVTLQAFGLEGDINNRFFIRKVLESSTFDTKALANKLADKRYSRLANAFGFGDFAVPRNKISDFADRMLGNAQMRGFEAAVGTRDENIRLALNAERELADLAGSTMGNDAKWFTLMGQPPLRAVLETAFGLPKAFGALDIDRQLAILKDKSTGLLGSDSVAQFSDPAKVEDLLRRFLLRADTAATAQAFGVPGSAALQLLQGMAQRR